MTTAALAQLIDTAAAAYARATARQEAATSREEYLLALSDSQGAWDRLEILKAARPTTRRINF